MSSRAARLPKARTWIAHAAWNVALAGGIVLRLALPAPSERTPDELAYTFYSDVLQRDGLAAERTLVANYPRDSLLAEFPPPTRVGMSLLGSLVMSVSGSNTMAQVVWLSTLCSVLQLAVVAILVVTTLDGWTAALAVAFLAVSPLDLAIARRAWADGLLGLVTSLMLLAFTQAATKPGGTAWRAALFLLGVLAPLVKESGLVLVVLATAGLALADWRASRVWRRPLLVLGGGIAAVATSAALLSLLCGGTAPWLAALDHAARGVAHNDYVRRYQTGTPLYYVEGLAILQPLPWLLGTVGALLVAVHAPLVRVPWKRPAAPLALAACAWLTLIAGGLACAYEQKNLRFLSPIYAPVAMLAAALVRSGVGWLSRRFSPHVARAVATVMVILLAISLSTDWVRFSRFFLRRDLPDLATPWFTGEHAADRD